MSRSSAALESVTGPRRHILRGTSITGNYPNVQYHLRSASQPVQICYPCPESSLLPMYSVRTWRSTGPGVQMAAETGCPALAQGSHVASFVAIWIQSC